MPSPASVRQDALELPPAGEVRTRASLRRALRRSAREEERLYHTTSRLSPYLRFGVVSALEVARRAAELPEGDRVLRKLAWRDFFAQLVAWDPSLVRHDLQPGRAPALWSDDHAAFEAWCTGTTGVEIVDAGMRQLHREGWMPNRARLIVASYLTRTLGVDWRRGAAYFDRHLVDGDPASNSGNWQWVAGTGANPRRGVALNMDRQAQRFDASGRYRLRYGEAG